MKLSSERINNQGVISARAGHASVLIDHKLYVFGGEDITGGKDDMYTFDLKTFTWDTI